MGDDGFGKGKLPKILFVDMQICPEWKNFPRSVLLTACSRSASSRTINAAAPPSSRVTGLIYFPHRDPMIEPTLVEPVKLTLLIITKGYRVSGDSDSICVGMTYRTAG
jgi:hypothetical protein